MARSRSSDWLSISPGLRRGAFIRPVVAAAMWRPGLSYVLASLADQANEGVRRVRRLEPAVDPFWRRRTAFRERVFLEGFWNPTCAWPFPRVIAGPDARHLEGPMVIVSFHLGTVLALGALFEQVPGPRLALFHGSAVHRPGVRAIDIRESGGAFAAKCALDTLRGNGFVFSIADGAGRSHVHADLFGRRIGLQRGTFTIARLAGAPLLPVAARWKGPMIEIVAGEPIAPGDESAMATALVRWLEAYLVEHPADVNNQLLSLLRAAPLTDGARAQGALHDPIPDLPGFRSRDRPWAHDHDPIGSETQRVKDRL